MKLLITTQAVDRADPILGFFHSWISELAKHYESIEVICLREGAHALPANVHVHTLGKERGASSSFTYAVRFKLLAWGLRDRYDAVFVHMNPEYVIIFGTFWRMLGKRITLWYNHPAYNLRLALAAFQSHQIFYTSPYAASARYKKAIQMPVGIDTALFSPTGAQRKPLSIYIQGRVAASKRVEVLLTALRLLRSGGMPATLTIVGPEDTRYMERLRRDFADLIPSAVTFLGPKNNDETPALYSTHHVAVNLAPAGHFDKSAFEAMACETPIIVGSRAFKDLVPGEWIVAENDPAALKDALKRLLAFSEQDYQMLGKQLRQTVEQHESLALLIKKLVEHIQPRVEQRTLRGFLLGVLYFFASTTREPRMTVLLYHAITDARDFFAVSPRAFDEQMKYLCEHYATVPLSRAFAHAAGKSIDRDSVAVTFDDGYKDFITAALPILEKYNIPATVFILGGTPDPADLGNTYPRLESKDLHLLTNPLVSIGSHAMTHKKLTKISREELVGEVRQSREFIERTFAIRPEYLAYPKGSFNAAVMQATSDAGYAGAVSVVERGVRISDSLYALPRVQVDSSTTMNEFRAKLTKAADWYYALWCLVKRQTPR